MTRSVLALALAGALPAAVSGQTSAAPAPVLASLIAPAVRVTDLDRSLRFYATALGLVPATTLHHGTMTEVILSAETKTGRPVLILLHDDAAARAAPLDPGNGFAKVVVRVADVAAVAARMTAAHDPVGAVHVSTLGPAVLMIRDPDGYAFELVQGGPTHG